MSIPNAEHGVKVTSRRQQRGACRVYDLRDLELRVLALEEAAPGPATARLRQRLAHVQRDRALLTWSTPARMEFVSLEHAVGVREVGAA